MALGLECLIQCFFDKFINHYGFKCWAKEKLSVKKEEIKFLVDGWTSKSAQRVIIMILKTCSRRDRLQIEAEVGELSTDLDEANQFKYNKLMGR